MLEKWAQGWAQRIEKFAVPFDSSRFADPVATQTKWVPIKGGGSSFLTHNLVMTAPHRAEFRGSLKALIFALIALSIGLAAFTVCLYEHFVNDSFTWSLNPFFLLAFGVVFAIVGWYLLYSATNPVVFDKRQGYFWKGRQSPDKILPAKANRRFAKLEEIHAIQLISERCSGENTYYYSYELNLVLKSGERLNVIDHGNLAAIREQASRLSEFLGKPVWDAA